MSVTLGFFVPGNSCRFERRANVASTAVSTTGRQPRRLARQGSRDPAQRQFGLLSAGSARRTYQRTLEGKRGTKDPRRRPPLFSFVSLVPVIRILSRFHRLEITTENRLSSIEIRANGTYSVKYPRTRHFDSSPSP